MRCDRRMLGVVVLGVGMAAAVPSGDAWAQEAIPPPLIPPATAYPPPPVVAPATALPPPPVVAPATALPPPPMVAPGGPVHVHQPGPIGRAVHHAGFTIKDRMIGEPERFVEPPLGWSIGRNFAAQAAMAEQHRFTLYRSDFFAGTERLTPLGIRRLGRMVARWDHWAGPMLVEIDPNRPGLAEARRLAVLELAEDNGTVLDPPRLLVGGSPYLGGRGDLSELYESVLIERSIQAPTVYPLNPIPNAEIQN